jgi:hypothetical protein
MLRLQGLGLCDLKPDRCVASDQINSYLEPDGRSRIMPPSMIPHDPRHLGISSGASKMIFVPMVRSAQTEQLFYVEISTISKQTETSFHLSDVT